MKRSPIYLCMTCALLTVAAAADTSSTESNPMHIPNAWLIPAREARELVAPWFQKHHVGADLERTLDEDLMFAGEAGGDVLALPAGTVIDRDLVLEWSQAKVQGRPIRGLLALGRLTISGDIRNDDWDGGPFLIVLGPLDVRHVLKRAAPLVAFGPVRATGTIYCEYNHGLFRALAGVSAEGIIMDDHSHELAGAIDAPVAVLDEGAPNAQDPQNVLLPQFFDDEDEYGRVYPVDDVNLKLRQRILAGEPVFRAEAPRGRPANPSRPAWR